MYIYYDKDNPLSDGIRSHFLKTVGDFKGVVYETHVPESVTDFTDIVSEITLDSDQAAIINLLDSNAMNLLESLDEFNIKPPKYSMITFIPGYKTLNDARKKMNGNYAWVQFPPNFYYYSDEEKYLNKMFYMITAHSQSQRAFAGVELWAQIVTKVNTTDVNIYRLSAYNIDNTDLLIQDGYDLIYGKNLYLRSSNYINTNPILLKFVGEETVIEYQSYLNFIPRVFIPENGISFFCNWQIPGAFEKMPIRISEKALIITSFIGPFSIQDDYSTKALLGGVDHYNAFLRGAAGVAPIVRVAESPEQEREIAEEFMKSDTLFLFACNNPDCLNNIRDIVDKGNKLLTTPTIYEGQNCSRNIFHTGLLPNQYIPLMMNYIIAQKLGTVLQFLGTEGLFSRTIAQMLQERYSTILTILEPIYYDANKIMFETIEVVEMINNMISNTDSEKKILIISSLNPVLSESLINLYRLRNFDVEDFNFFSLTMDQKDVSSLIKETDRNGIFLVAPYFYQGSDYLSSIIFHFSGIDTLSAKSESAYVGIAIIGLIMAQLNFNLNLDIVRVGLMTGLFPFPIAVPEFFLDVSNNMNLIRSAKIAKYDEFGQLSIVKTGLMIKDPVVYSYFINETKGYQCNLLTNSIKEKYNVESIQFVIHTKHPFYSSYLEIVDLVSSTIGRIESADTVIDLIFNDIGSTFDQCKERLLEKVKNVAIVFTTASIECQRAVIDQYKETDTIFINIGTNFGDICDSHYFSIYPSYNQFSAQLTYLSQFKTNFVIWAPVAANDFFTSYLTELGIENIIKITVEVEESITDTFVEEKLNEMKSAFSEGVIIYYGTDANHIIIGHKIVELEFPDSFEFYSFTTSTLVAKDEVIKPFNAITPYFLNLESEANREFQEKIVDYLSPSTVIVPEMILVYNTV